MKKFMSRIASVAMTLSMLVLLQTTALASVLVFDRGLPTANLNNAAGPSRSNVAWAWWPSNDYVTGDDFSIGSPGEVWVITKLRGWSVQGAPGITPLGNRFQSVTLYGGSVDSASLPLVSAAEVFGPLEELLSGTLELDSSINSNSNITHTPVQYVGGLDYQGSSGSFIQIWQHDFNMAWVVDGGETYVFAADGILQSGVPYYWFNHASNAALSGSLQQGADDLYLAWEQPDLDSFDPCDSGDSINCGGWDKSSDLNVQIWASLVATSKDQCKKGGWETLVRTDLTSFKNQGDCIQYVNTGK